MDMVLFGAGCMILGGVMGDFSQWETQLPLAQAGACDYVVEST